MTSDFEHTKVFKAWYFLVKSKFLFFFQSRLQTNNPQNNLNIRQNGDKTQQEILSNTTRILESLDLPHIRTSTSNDTSETTEATAIIAKNNHKLKNLNYDLLDIFSIIDLNDWTYYSESYSGATICGIVS